MVAHCWSIIALLAVSSLAAEAAETNRDCAALDADKTKVETLVKSISAMRFELRKEPAPVQCKKLVSGAVSEAVKVKLVPSDQEDEQSKFRRIVEVMRQRANCLKASSPMSAAGLRSLVSYLKGCVDQDQPSAESSEGAESPEPERSSEENLASAADEPEMRAIEELKQSNQKLASELSKRKQEVMAKKLQVEQAIDELKNLDLKLINKVQLNNANVAELKNCRSRVEELDNMKEYVRKLEREARNFADENQAQREEIATKSGVISKFSVPNKQKLGDKLASLESEIHVAERELESWRKVAATNLKQLKKCRGH